MKMFRKGQKGFTLVEIAIVLVIVGLVLFGVLKGTDMVKSGKLKKSTKQMEQLSAAVYTYMDKFKGKLPGETSSDVLGDLKTAEIIGTDTLTNGYGGPVIGIIDNSATIVRIDSGGVPQAAALELQETVGVIVMSTADPTTVRLNIKK